MSAAKAAFAVAVAAFGAACSSGTGGDTAPAQSTSSNESGAESRVYLSELLPDGSMSFMPGDGVIGGKRYAHSFVTDCQGCLPVGEAGQQDQPGMEFTVPDDVNQLNFVAGLTDSSTDTDRSAGVSVWTNQPELTKLFESQDVTVGVGTPISVAVAPGNRVRIDGWGLNGNESLCVCDPELVAEK